MNYKDLTANIEEALGAENLAFALTVDFDGNATVFESQQGEGSDVRFPLPNTEPEIRNVFTATFVAVGGKSCVYYTDSTGRRRRRCT